MKQKRVRLTEHGLETIYDLKSYVVVHFERLTKPLKIYFSKINDPDEF